MTDSSLYDRLGGAFAIAAVVDHFSDAIVRNPIVGQTSENTALREWHTNNYQQSRQTPRAQVHAHPVGVRRRRWAPAIRRHGTGQYSTRPRRSSPRAEDLARRVR